MRALSQAPDKTAGAPLPPGSILHRSTAWLLAAAIALPLAILGVGAWLSWRAAWRTAAAELVHTADAGAEYGKRVLAGYGVADNRLNDLVRGLSDADIRARERELHEALRSVVADLPQAEAGSIVDRQGFPLVSAGTYPVPRLPITADRDFFIDLRQEAAPGLYVSRIHHGRLSKEVYFAVSRRRTGTGNGLPPGEFDGIVYVAVFPDKLAAGLRRLLGDQGDGLGLIREDGQFLARGSGTVSTLPQIPEGTEFRAATAANRQEAVYTAPSALDGSPQLIAIQRLEGLPIYASAARPRAAIIAHWWEAFLPQLAIGLPATLALAGLALLIRRGERQMVAANLSLEARVQERTAAMAELSEALDLAPTSVVGLDGFIRYWSSGCERLYGYSRAEALGQPATRLLRSEFPAGGRDAAMAALRRNGEWQGELRQRRRDGSPIITACHWILRRDPASGEPASIVSSRTDMTALRKTERALIESEARLRRAQEASGVVAFSTGPEGVLTASDAHLALLGLPPGTHLDLAGLLGRIHPDDRQAVLADRHRLARDGGSFVQEFRVIRPEGTQRWLVARGEAEANPGGDMPLRITGVMFDITGRKAGEAALAESEERLRLAQETAGIGIYDFDFLTGSIAWDARMRAIWGVPQDEPITKRLFVQGIHPKDRRRRREAVKRAMDPRGPRRYRLEYRVIGPQDGVERWVAATGQVRFAGDRPVRLVGTMLDITARKRAEQRSILLMREVDHRAKNALAVVQAALRLTRAEDPAEFVRIVEGRVAALARAQTMLAQRRWEGAELRTLLEGELAPFLDEARQGGPRARLSGPPVTVAARAAQPLSMALHELATNALKYGALSLPDGMLTVTWRLAPMERLLHLTWRESGGPRIAAPPGRRGFGSRVIEQTVQLQLGGSVTRHWMPGGLVCEMTVPLGRDAQADAATRNGEAPDSAAAA